MTRWLPPPPPELPLDAHKGVAGHVVLGCGSADMPGAAVLASRAAQRAGAGLVTVVYTDVEVRRAVVSAAPEAIFAALERFEPDERRQHAALVGPGIGRGDAGRALFHRLVADWNGPLVIDADGLTLLAEDAGVLHDRTHAVVLTPHPGEAERLLGAPVGASENDRTAAARAIARRFGAICCLKGRGTVVASAERVYVNDTGNPGMATAGSGDVLAGIAVAYLAACSTLPSLEWTPFAAAARAVRVHGCAGDLAARALGRRGLVASDLIAHLPRAAAELDSRE